MNYLAVAGCSLLTSVSLARMVPSSDVTYDPALHNWFESLRQPGTQLSCCSISDCHFTSYNQRDGHFEVTVDDWPYVVPDENVLLSTVNPTGKAVICYNYISFGPPTLRGEVRTAPQDMIEIRCFLPERPPS
jgi:hypothetical protein